MTIEIRAAVARCLRGLALVTFTLALLGAKGCQTYYVSPTGVDASTRDGSQAQPWKTLGYAVGRVAANQGHVIHLTAGTFTQNSPVVVPTGVKIEGEGPGVTTISSTFKNGPLIQLVSSSVEAGGQVVRKLTIDGNGRRLHSGILIKMRTFVTIDQVAVRDTKNYGIHIESTPPAPGGAGPSAYLNDIVVTNTTLTNCSRDNSGWSSGALEVGGLDGAVIRNITIDEDQGYGIKFCNDGFLKRLTLTDCTINTPQFDQAWGSDAAVELWNVSDDSEVARVTANNWLSFVGGRRGGGTRSVHVHDNDLTIPTAVETVGIEASVADMEISHNVIRHGLPGIGIWGPEAMTDMSVHHNVIFNPDGVKRWGIQLFPYGAPVAYGPIDISNNTVDGVEIGVVFQIRNGGRIRDVTIDANLVMNTDSVLTFWDQANGTTVSNVSLDTDFLFNAPIVVGAAVPAVAVQQSNVRIGDPLITGSGTRPTPYYVPQPGSPLVGALPTGGNVGAY